MTGSKEDKREEIIGALKESFPQAIVINVARDVPKNKKATTSDVPPNPVPPYKID